MFACDGRPLEPGQTPASNVAASDFQDFRHFPANGGENGPQRKILREGTYPADLRSSVRKDCGSERRGKLVPDRVPGSRTRTGLRPVRADSPSG